MTTTQTSYGSVWGMKHLPEKCPHCERELKVVRRSTTTVDHCLCAYCGREV